MLVSSIESKRLELFQLQFNLVEFLTFLSDKYKKNHNILNDFINIDTDSDNTNYKYSLNYMLDLYNY